MVILGTLVTGWHDLSLLKDERLAQNLISGGLWQKIVAACGGTVRVVNDHHEAQFDLAGPVSAISLSSLGAWLLGGAALAFWQRRPVRDALIDWGWYGWMWWLLLLGWELLDFLALIAGWTEFEALLRGTLPLWHSLELAGWLTTFVGLAWRGRDSGVADTPRMLVPWPVWGAMLAYFVAFGAMNWGMYESLMVPHGDSAMYEEHLWNLLHGKGFRSYLDNGRLFLGEHIQVVHILLVPLYVLWPSQILLELLQSAILASGAIPTYWLARRHTGSSKAATALAIGYLFYIPMQFLDIAVDFKTFRPNSFEIPLFLVAFDALERGRWRAFWLALVLALSCQEDAAMTIAPLGVWIALRAAAIAAQSGASIGRLRRIGAGLAIFGTAWVLFVVKIWLPWMRGEADPHFIKYFPELGESSGGILVNMLRHPGVVLGRLLNGESVNFALTLLAPLGFVSLFSPGRLAIAVPMFGVLCLSDITNSPQHHFHAPIVPVMVWSAAAGLSCVPELWRRMARTRAAAGGLSVEVVALCAALCAATTGLFLGLSPLSIAFWDPASRGYWRTQYVPGERALQFPKVLAQIPPESRVASTDFIHPRFTHYTRSYDYSSYRPDVPDDAGYLVIDTQGPYSEMHRPDQVPELRKHPERWELLPDRTNGLFIILKRRPTAE